jgi:hypothetical protein
VTGRGACDLTKLVDVDWLQRQCNNSVMLSNTARIVALAD